MTGIDPAGPLLVPRWAGPRPTLVAVICSWLVAMAVPVLFVYLLIDGKMPVDRRLQDFTYILFQPVAVAAIGGVLLGTSKRWPDNARIARLMSAVPIGWMVGWAVAVQALLIALGKPDPNSPAEAAISMAISLLCAASYGAMSLLTVARVGSRLRASVACGAIAPLPAILLLVLFWVAEGVSGPGSSELPFIAGILFVLSLFCAATAAFTTILAPRIADPAPTTPSDRF